ncbi:choice-of-anchor G family protein [Microbacterium sp. NPDC096154]|uniref:choice-of-anchor G family protein n=1 Tax=Microbacterium sp. NPDC096154 TaxID=3155549 RepID=UPI003322612F
MGIAATGVAFAAGLDSYPSDPAEAEASVLGSSILDAELVGGADSEAGFPTNPGPVTSDILNAEVLGSQLVDVGGIQLPLDQIIDFGQLGALLSQSTASDEFNGEAISGLAGGDGAVTLDGSNADFGTATIDLLSLFEAAGVAGVTDLALDQADLLLGAGGAHVQAIDGVFQDPDGVGGLGQYRVAEASLLLHSQLIDDAADMMYTAIGSFETQIRDSINSIFDLGTILGATGVSADVQINSDIQQQVFSELLEQPICSSVTVDPAAGENVCDTENTILSIDFGTGTATIHLDNIMDGERPDDPERPTGINNQDPNTELIDDEIYPMVAESVHDVMNAALDIAAGAVENALNAITIDMTFTVPNATKSLSLGLNGDIIAETDCVGSGITGTVACTTLNAAMTTVIRPALTAIVAPALQTLLDNGAQAIFDVAIGDVKTNAITVPVRQVVEPILELAAQVLSVQLNHHVTESCTLPDGTEAISSLEVSALSIGLLQGAGSDGAAHRPGQCRRPSGCLSRAGRSGARGRDAARSR